jgi:hypothetical protein
MLVNCNFVGYKHPIFDELIGYNRDIRKVRKRQHRYPEFGHTQDEIFKNLQKSTLALNNRGETHEPSILMVPEFHQSFFFPE